MIIKSVNVNKLHGEFIRANIIPFPVFDMGDGNGDFTFPEGTDIEAVQTIIEAHDTTPLPPPLTTEERVVIAEQALNDIIMMMF